MSSRPMVCIHGSEIHVVVHEDGVDCGNSSPNGGDDLLLVVNEDDRWGSTR